MMAFYPDRIEVYEVSEAELTDRRRDVHVEGAAGAAGAPRTKAWGQKLGSAVPPLRPGWQPQEARRLASA
jgi:hypothetical protein